MEEHWAGLWEHIEDLRRTLLRSLAVVGGGFLVLLLFYQPILGFLASQPFNNEEHFIKKHIRLVQITNQDKHPQFFKLPSIASFPSSEKVKENQVLLASGESIVYEEAIESPLLILGPLEGIGLVFKVCFWLSLLVTAPGWGWIWLQFILPGLRETERAALIPFLILSLFFLTGGMAFAYFITLPISNQFFVNFNNSIAQNAWTLAYYVDYVLLLCLGHGVAAQLALLLIILVHFGLFSADRLVEKRRIMIVIAFILAAFLTPPDIFTQLLLAIPLIGLYEGAICYARWKECGSIFQKRVI